ncbi:MAG: hypothetical protein QM737_13045 [Ferruginibacter sp.]
MNNLKLVAGFLLLFSFKTVNAQKPSITIDTIVLKLTITTMEGKPLKTKVLFENLETHKIKSCVSNAAGKANCVLPTENTYRITIPNSDNYYDYEIPEFVISPVELKFKFSLKALSN